MLQGAPDSYLKLSTHLAYPKPMESKEKGHRKALLRSNGANPRTSGVGDRLPHLEDGKSRNSQTEPQRGWRLPIFHVPS
jgi:hypothetical protein